MASNSTEESDRTVVSYALSLPEILEKIFGHLPAKDILNCRLVSFEWRLAASYSENVIKKSWNRKEFIKHLKSLRHRFNLLPCRNFRLYGYEVKHLYPILRIFGLSLTRLELGYNLQPNSLIRILLWCTNLKSLHLEHGTCKGKMDNIPSKLLSTWNNNPFPQLQHIGINEGYWKTDEAIWTLLEALIKGSPKISTIDFLYGSDERCKRLIDLLSIETNLPHKLTKLKIRLQSNIQQVKSLSTYPLMLTHLEMFVKYETTTEIFIAMVASTLYFLKLSAPLDYVPFIRIIKKMKNLRTITTNDVIIMCDFDIELAKMIPNVIRLEMKIRLRDFDDIRMFGHRWMGIYPQMIQQNEQKKRFIQQNLKYFISKNITINDPIIISDIFNSFQMLRKVSIDIFVDCLNCLASGLKNSSIQELCLVIINYEDPKQVTKQELNAFHDALSNMEYLTDLDINYYQKNSGTCKTLHVESTWKNCSQLKTLRLIGFNIPECMIHEMMTSKCLKLLRLFQCKLRMDTVHVSYDDIKFKIFQNRYPTALINIYCLSWNPRSTSKAVNFYFKHDQDMSKEYYFPN